MKEKYIHVLVFVAVLIIAIHQKFWTYDWTYIYIGAALAIGARVASKHGVWLGLTAAYFLGRGFWGMTPRASYPMAGKYESMIMETVTSGGTLTVLACLLGALALGKYLKYVPEIIAAICFSDLLLVLAQGSLGQYPGGFLGNSSMNSCFLVATFPYLAGYLETKTDKEWVTWVAWAVLGGAVALGGSAIAMGMYAVFTLTVLAAWAPSVAVPVALIAGVGWLVFKDHRFLTDNGRFQIWQTALDFQRITIAHEWFGTGPGTWGVYVPTMQRLLLEPGQRTSMFPWMHNDWLQLLLEYGRVGFVLFVGATVVIIKKAAQEFEIPSVLSLLLFILFGMFNYPLHSPGAALVISLMVAYVLRGGYAYRYSLRDQG